MAKPKNYSIAERIQALTLAESGQPYAHITAVTGMSKSQIVRLRKKAKERGYDPSVSGRLKEEYVQDAPRSGRPEVVDEEKEKEMLELVRVPSGGGSREMTVAEIARRVGISTTTAHRRLKKKGSG